MSHASDRNDISTEPSPGPEQHDNLGAEDGKGDPPTVPPAGRSAGQGDVVAEDPDDEG